MLYAAALEVLGRRAGELAGPRRKFELSHMRTLAAALGDPQSRFPAVLIAGTNGKGSTAATLAAILTASGYRTGLYTSPHLLRVNERIQITGDSGLQPIADDRFGAHFEQVERAAESLVSSGALPALPSYFETLTAMAFLAFADAGVDVAVLEVGLGGRLDATNIVEPLASIITDIALDHTEWLGPTLTDIAREKAGILRPGGVLITLPQHPEANASIGERAVALDVTGINAAAYLPQPSPRTLEHGVYTVPAFGTDLHVEPALAGDHQRRNLALALAAAEYLQLHRGFHRITAATVQQGTASVRWPGRLQRLALPGGISALLDVAHNPAGIWTLRSYLSRCFALPADAPDALPAPRTLIFSALADKALEEMAQILFPLLDEPGDRILLVPVHSPRAAAPERLHAVAREAAVGSSATVAVLDGIADALAQVRSHPRASVIVAGSLYLVAEWMAATAA